jgi:hypothetical protein
MIKFSGPDQWPIVRVRQTISGCLLNAEAKLFVSNLGSVCTSYDIFQSDFIHVIWRPSVGQNSIWWYILGDIFDRTDPTLLVAL